MIWLFCILYKRPQQHHKAPQLLQHTSSHCCNKQCGQVSTYNTLHINRGGVAAHPSACDMLGQCDHSWISDAKRSISLLPYFPVQWPQNTWSYTQPHSPQASGCPEIALCFYLYVRIKAFILNEEQRFSHWKSNHNVNRWVLFDSLKSDKHELINAIHETV